MTTDKRPKRKWESQLVILSDVERPLSPVSRSTNPQHSWMPATAETLTRFPASGQYTVLRRSPLAEFFHVEPKILYLELLDDFPSENESSTATHHLAQRPRDWRGERRRAQPVNIWLPPWESRKTGYLGRANYSLDMPFCIPNFQPPPKTAEHHLPSDFPKSHCAGPGLIWFGSSVAGKPA